MKEMFYIDGEVAERLKQGVADGVINVYKLFEMETSEQRLAIWEKHVPKELAAQINAQFENAMASDDNNAMQKFAESFVKAIRRALEVKEAAERLTAKMYLSQPRDSLDSAML